MDSHTKQVQSNGIWPEGTIATQEHIVMKADATIRSVARRWTRQMWHPMPHVLDGIYVRYTCESLATAALDAADNRRWS